jgi:hypothetical protein
MRRILRMLRRKRTEPTTVCMSRGGYLLAVMED